MVVDLAAGMHVCACNNARCNECGHEGTCSNARCNARLQQRMHVCACYDARCNECGHEGAVYNGFKYWVMQKVSQNHGIFNREIAKYTVIYGAHIRIWPTLVMQAGADVQIQ